MPTTASMSSVFSPARSADKCIDGDEAVSFCITLKETAPWLALEYGGDVQVRSVVLINRNSSSAVAARTKNMQVRVSSSPPVSGSEMFTGGQLLGTFEGPGTEGQRIEVTGGSQLTGRYVVVQVDHTAEASHLNLIEATSWSQGRMFILGKPSQDGVGPVDNRSSTDLLHHFVQKNKHVRADT